MKKYFKVSFQHSGSVFCTNIAKAENEQAVLERYKKEYKWVSVSECTDYELETARRKGMPFVEIK